MPNKLWVEVYRPSAIDGYVFQTPEHKVRFLKFIEDKSIPHLLFKGHRGTGKTTLAFILKNEIGVADMDFKVLNASDDNSVDNVRDGIKAFVSSMPIGDFKIVLLDESDFLSPNAQAALKRIMEEYSDTARFILTCNNPHKIIPEIKSRCQEFEFKEFEKEDMILHAYRILKKEKIKKVDVNLVKSYVDDCYPDMRKLIQCMEGNIVDGVLCDPVTVGGNDKMYMSIISELNNGKWMEVRENIISGVTSDEWDEIYKFLYDNLSQVTGFTDIMNWKQGILIIADYLRFHHQVADPEINFTACMIRLSNILGNK